MTRRTSRKRSSLRRNSRRRPALTSRASKPKKIKIQWGPAIDYDTRIALGLPVHRTSRRRSSLRRNSRRVTAKNRNLYRLQDVYYYLYDRGFVGGAMTDAQALTQARKALRDAGVVIPRETKTAADLWRLAKKVGDAHGFDAHAGEYRKTP